MHSSVAIFIPLVVALSLSYSVNAMAITDSWICEQCSSQEECDQPPTHLCVWGEARDACRRRICAKGPDERCGGTRNVLGVCGSGMMCKEDERCHGCYVQTMQCSQRY